MASITRREIAEIIHRKMDQLGGGLEPTDVGSGQAEGDYTDGIDSALRMCQLSDITKADTMDKISAAIVATEYYMLQRMLNKWISRPTTQQGAGASGLHLMVQTESTVAALRMNVKAVRGDMINALAKIGVKIDSASLTVAGIAEIDHEDAVTQDLVIGAHALPWFKEGYWPVQT
jgi:hypothetical protein